MDQAANCSRNREFSRNCFIALSSMRSRGRRVFARAVRRRGPYRPDRINESLGLLMIAESPAERDAMTTPLRGKKQALTIHASNCSSSCRIVYVKAAALPPQGPREAGKVRTDEALKTIESIGPLALAPGWCRSTSITIDFFTPGHASVCASMTLPDAWSHRRTCQSQEICV